MSFEDEFSKKFTQRIIQLPERPREPLSPTVMYDRVWSIKKLGESGDFEKAHSHEDELYIEVLKQLAAEGHWLASVALMTQDFDFERHCA